ncbi:hypothetical protein C8F04DRAFT_1174731 [Mycena alexandri]|uniref:Uncharacterized protein n=1 Tax=Mycena alexandri TaxID=1745969 RepID=A0AAD6TDP6_9AGAR|nr:hypothetical protein C8F04DRAFT_1174731 [Mycena alexandri]
MNVSFTPPPYSIETRNPPLPDVFALLDLLQHFVRPDSNFDPIVNLTNQDAAASHRALESLASKTSPQKVPAEMATIWHKEEGQNILNVTGGRQIRKILAVRLHRNNVGPGGHNRRQFELQHLSDGECFRGRCTVHEGGISSRFCRANPILGDPICCEELVLILVVHGSDILKCSPEGRRSLLMKAFGISDQKFALR